MDYKINFNIIIFFLIFNISKGQDKINSIAYTDSTLIINDLVLYSFHVKQEIPYLIKKIEDIKTLKRKLHGFKFKRTKEFEDQYCYYILNSGIQFQCTSDKTDLITMTVYYDKTFRSTIFVNNKFKTFSGKLKILNYEITSTTKLGDFLNDDRFKYCTENSKASVAFKCRTPFECELVFDGDKQDSKIRFVYFNLF
ncbi:MAG: hypothetical protein ACK5QC_12775 [Bacteroidota bacterium]